MTRHSTERRISTWLSGFILVAGSLAAVALFLLILGRANDSQDAQLDQFAAALSRHAVTNIGPSHLPQDVEEAETRFVVAPLGVVPGTADAEVNVVFPASLADGLQTTVLNGRMWRVMVARDADGGRFAVAQTAEARHEVALDAALLVMLPMTLLIPVLLVAVRIALRRAFEPLHRLALEADGVDGTKLTALRTGDVPSELVPFVDAVNRLLTRLGATLDQQRRLVANAAHELRSPVHALTIQAQNIRAVAVTPEAIERVASLGAGLQRMALLLDQLLGFARLQAGVRRLAVDVDLAEVIRSAILTTLPLATAKDIDLGCTRLDPVTVVAMAEDAWLLVRNAIDNAVRYTPAGGRVDVALWQDDDGICFTVDDNGPGIAAADIDRVFDPFVRILGSHEVGSGLGLSIARAAADAMGGAITLHNRAAPASGLSFVYRQASAGPTSSPTSRIA